MKNKFFKMLDVIFFYIYNRLGICLMDIKEDQILFLTEARSELDGNLKAMYDYIIENSMEYDCTVFVKADRRERESLRKRVKIYKALTTSKYIFLDDFYGITSAMKVRSGQKLIQLWHGSGAFKKFGFSRVNAGESLKGVHTGYRKYTDVAVTSEATRICYAEAFDVDINKVKAIGSPRTDIFFNEKTMRVTRERLEWLYPEIIGKKLVLIAPTYRGKKVQDASYAFDKLQLDKICDDLGDEYVVGVKWHPAIKNNINRGKINLELCERIIDFTDYGDINDLLIVTDTLVTDYSSVIFDYYLLNKPIVYFTYDLEEYDGGRGFYFDFEEYIYGNEAKDYNQLINQIKKGELCVDKRKAFGEKFMKACDGKSCERVVSWILEEDIKDGQTEAK